MNRALVGTMLEVAARAGARSRPSRRCSPGARGPRRATPRRRTGSTWRRSPTDCQGSYARPQPRRVRLVCGEDAPTPLLLLLAALAACLAARPGRRSGAHERPRGHRRPVRPRCSTSRPSSARSSSGCATSSRGTRWTTPRRGSRRGPSCSAPAATASRSCCTSPATTCVIKKAKLPSVAQYQLEGRAPRAVLPRPRACASSARGTRPTTPASRPIAARPGPRSSSARCTAWSRGTAPRARWWPSTCSTRPASSATCRPGTGALSSTYRRRATLVGHPQLRRRQPRAHDLHVATSSASRTSTTARRSSGSPRPAGIVKFGRSFPCSTSRAASRLKNMFKLARTYHSSGVERAYVYNWTGAGCDARFDAGLTTPAERRARPTTSCASSCPTSCADMEVGLSRR